MISKILSNFNFWFVLEYGISTSFGGVDETMLD